MTVMFTALVAVVAFGERIGWMRVLGLVLGFCGVIVLATGRMGNGSVALPAVAGTLAALCYGVGINLVSRQLKGLPPAALVPAMLIGAAIVLAPFAIATWPKHAIALPKWGSAFMLGALCTGIAYLLYFRLIARIGPARTATVTYLIPVFTVLWSWLLLGEPATASMLGAGALVLGGVALSQLGK
jgi:drug/metabolite transporter (DMT)-like permease